MYKLLVTIVFILAVSSQLFAQKYEYVPFPDSGAVWSEMYSSDKTKVIYERFALSGEDTIINDISYKKLYIFYNKTFDKNNAKCIGGIREDKHKRVYFKGDSLIHYFKPLWLVDPPLDEILLYDFSLGIGDTTYLTIGPLDSMATIVQNIDTILFGNTFRKVFKISNDIQWIEGIGNIRGLLYSSGATPISGEYGDLIYFIKEDTILYHYAHYDDCFPTSNGLTEQTLENKIKIYPNPITNNEARISFNGLNIESISIYNEYGCFITSFDARGLNNAIIPLSNIAPGVYFYNAFTKQGNQISGKFMVQ